VYETKPWRPKEIDLLIWKTSPDMTLHSSGLQTFWAGAAAPRRNTLCSYHQAVRMRQTSVQSNGIPWMFCITKRHFVSPILSAVASKSSCLHLLYSYFIKDFDFVQISQKVVTYSKLLSAAPLVTFPLSFLPCCICQIMRKQRMLGGMMGEEI